MGVVYLMFSLAVGEGKSWLIVLTPTYINKPVPQLGQAYPWGKPRMRFLPGTWGQKGESVFILIVSEHHRLLARSGLLPPELTHSLIITLCLRRYPTVFPMSRCLCKCKKAQTTMHFPITKWFHISIVLTSSVATPQPSPPTLFTGPCGVRGLISKMPLTSISSLNIPFMFSPLKLKPSPHWGCLLCSPCKCDFSVFLCWYSGDCKWDGCAYPHCQLEPISLSLGHCLLNILFPLFPYPVHWLYFKIDLDSNQFHFYHLFQATIISHLGYWKT